MNSHSTSLACAKVRDMTMKRRGGKPNIENEYENEMNVEIIYDYRFNFPLLNFLTYNQQPLISIKNDQCEGKSSPVCRLNLSYE
jgi:hypothetical protein